MKVDVRGKSIGKGFQGCIKRYNHGRGPMSHGSKFHRSMGSIGAGTTPGRVVRGLHMPGHMGDDNVCARRLTVVRVDTKKVCSLSEALYLVLTVVWFVISASVTKWN
jgi:large subunit ribosomal protein L3